MTFMPCFLGKGKQLAPKAITRSQPQNASNHAAASFLELVLLRPPALSLVRSFHNPEKAVNQVYGALAHAKRALFIAPWKRLPTESLHFVAWASRRSQ